MDKEQHSEDDKFKNIIISEKAHTLLNSMKVHCNQPFAEVIDKILAIDEEISINQEVFAKVFRGKR